MVLERVYSIAAVDGGWGMDEAKLSAKDSEFLQRMAESNAPVARALYNACLRPFTDHIDGSAFYKLSITLAGEVRRAIFEAVK